MPAPVKYDLLLSGATVIDPSQGIDAVRDVAVRDGLVAAVSEGIDPAEARDRIDLSGRISPSIRFNVGAAAVGEQYDNDFSAFPAIRRTLDAYRLVHGGMDFRISPRASLYLQLENAFDADYEDVFGYRNPGRRALAGCTLRL